jgi:hypothetical protein
LGFVFNYPSDWELTTEVTDVIEITKDRARIVITYRFDVLGGGYGSPNLEGSSYELSGLKVYKYKLKKVMSMMRSNGESPIHWSKVLAYFVIGVNPTNSVAISKC